jgi:pyruvate,water dikinase
MIQSDKELENTILNRNSEELYSFLKNQEKAIYKKFFKEFNKFLDNYGHRGFTREPYYPRWEDAPEYVFDILRSLITDRDQELKIIKEKSGKKRDLVEKLVETKIRDQFLGFIKWKIFSIILKLARKYIKFRELQRFNLDRWITRLRKAYLEIGNILSKKGLLNKKSDIFFFRKKELKKLIYHGDQTIKSKEITIKLNKRKKIFKKYENTVPPKFIIGNREFEDSLKYHQNSVSFRGIPASQGIAKSKVRVLYNIEEIPNVKAGEILVVSKTDPGWTPCFSKIGGLITETGGVLSHGAVVSREYGIPAVTNISNACKIFETGQIVKINGYNGIGHIKKRKNEVKN